MSERIDLEDKAASAPFEVEPHPGAIDEKVSPATPPSPTPDGAPAACCMRGELDDLLQLRQVKDREEVVRQSWARWRWRCRRWRRSRCRHLVLRFEHCHPCWQQFQGSLHRKTDARCDPFMDHTPEVADAKKGHAEFETLCLHMLLRILVVGLSACSHPSLCCSDSLARSCAPPHMHL